jgi:hypothetical protein
MRKRSWLPVLLSLSVLALMVPPAQATQKIPTLLGHYESGTIDQYEYITPSLTALGVDTAVVTITLPRELPYALISSVPTWRILVGSRTSTANVDSVKCEVWLGRTAKTYRHSAFAAGGILNAKQKAFDVTLYPLPTFRTLVLYITNADSTAAIFNLDIGVLKGPTK